MCQAQAKALQKNGERDKWFSTASEDTKRLTATVNGPLFEQLLKEAGHPDVKCADLFREGKYAGVRHVSVGVGALHVAPGADLYGDLPSGVPDDGSSEKEWVDLTELFSENRQDHSALFASLKEDKNAKALHDLTIKDAELGRMTMPKKASECNLANVRARESKCI